MAILQCGNRCCRQTQISSLMVCSDTVKIHVHVLTLQVQETKLADIANSVDLDEVAHYEPPHLGLHCLPSSL